MTAEVDHPWSSDDEENFIPVHACAGKVQLSPINDDNEAKKKSDFEAGGDNNFKSEKPSAAFPKSPFKTLPTADPDFTERLILKAGLNEDSIAKLKGISFDKLVADYKNMGLPETEVAKLHSVFQEELLKKWDPASLLQELENFEGLGEFGKTGSLSILKMCYFIQNLNAHLLTMRQETIELQRSISDSRKANESTTKGLDDENNANRMCEMIIAGRKSCLKLDEAMGDLIDVLKNERPGIVRFLKKNTKYLQTATVVTASVIIGYMVGKQFGGSIYTSIINLAKMYVSTKQAM